EEQMSRTTVKLDSDVRDILSRSSFDGTTLMLPPAQLERTVYQRVDKAIKALGGKWNRKAKGHVFDYDPREHFAAGVEPGEVRHLKNEFQFFETPPEIARHLVELAEINDDQQILEPSAGRGAIIRAMQEKITGFLVTAVEKDERHIKTLEKLGVHVEHADF